MDSIYYILVLIYDKVFSQISLFTPYVICCSTSVSVQFSLLISDKAIWQKMPNHFECNLRLMLLNFRFRCSRASTYKT